MGHRLTKIYTRTGDAGGTGLADGSRVQKDGARIEAMGTIDELNSQIAAVLVAGVPPEVGECLIDVQHTLFDIGGELAIPGATRVVPEDVQALEEALDRFNATLPPLKEFILPGGGAGAVAAHVARAVCRRAERRVLALSRDEFVAQPTRSYLNRLSDLLFVLARVLGRSGRGEVYWQPGRRARAAERT